jgi:hypothetical protein
MLTTSDTGPSGVPTDDLTPDYDNRDPLRNVRPGSPRAHSRFPVVPSLGQGRLAVHELKPVSFPENPLDGLAGEEQAFFRSAMVEIVGEDILGDAIVPEHRSGS